MVFVEFYTDFIHGAVGLLDFTQTDSGYWGPRVMFFEMLASCPASSLLALSSKNKGMLISQKIVFLEFVR